MASQKIRNMEEFAAVSGISRPTVSKYFNDPGSVRRSTRERIESALARYDFRPNIYAINQNRRSTKTIGIVVPYLSDPFFSELARTIQRLCIEADFRPMLFDSHGEPELESEHLDSLSALRPAGVLLAPLGRRSERAAIRDFSAHTPTVLFDGRLEDIGDAFVGSNNDQSVGLIVDYLCRTGEPPCFFEMRTPSNPNAFKRRAAYEKAMETLGYPPQFVQVEGDGWEFEKIGYREGLRAFAKRKFVTNTVLCSNDRLAIGLLAGAYEIGLRVGRGYGCAFRVAGHDDHPFARYTCPQLTTVSQDYQSIARTSVERLLEILDAGSPARDLHVTLFEGTLVMRPSA